MMRLRYDLQMYEGMCVVVVMVDFSRFSPLSFYFLSRSPHFRRGVL